MDAKSSIMIQSVNMFVVMDHLYNFLHVVDFHPARLNTVVPIIVKTEYIEDNRLFSLGL